MTLADMPFHALAMETYQRSDGESFRFETRLYEAPPEFDYWLATYDARHDAWGHLRFTLVIPKQIAITLDFAQSIVLGSAALQVQALLDEAGPNGRNLSPCFSTHGWILT